MEIINPSVELWTEENVSAAQHIARCARVCYGHEGEGKDPQKLVDGLMKSGHVSMLRHASRYFCYKDVDVHHESRYYSICPYNTVVNFDQANAFRHQTIWLSTNEQEFKLSKNFFYDTDYAQEMKLEDVLENAKVHPELFDIVRLTFCLTTQIGTARELNRTSPNNIAERSTRYCKSGENIVICKPWWYDDDFMHELREGEDKSERERDICKHLAYQHAMDSASHYYNQLLEYGMKPEDARGAIPLDAATKVVYTYSVREWRHIIDLRYYEKTGKAHPNAKLIMGMVRKEINAFAEKNNISATV
jgi:thymidylate synthase ThyX